VFIKVDRMTEKLETELKAMEANPSSYKLCVQRGSRTASTPPPCPH
jgi:hypothetical protein